MKLANYLSIPEPIESDRLIRRIGCADSASAYFLRIRRSFQHPDVQNLALSWTLANPTYTAASKISVFYTHRYYFRIVRENKVAVLASGIVIIPPNVHTCTPCSSSSSST